MNWGFQGMGMVGREKEMCFFPLWFSPFFPGTHHVATDMNPESWITNHG